MQVEVTQKVPKKVLRYASRDYRPGDKLEMHDKHANIFITLGHVRPYQRQDMSAEDLSVEDAERPKRRYRRRDMQAE